MFVIDNSNTIQITRGDTGEFDILLANADGSEYEVQPDDVVTFTVKRDTNTDEVLIQKTGTHIEIEPADTSGLSYGTYKYDIQVTFGTRKVDTVIPPSNFIVKDEVTF